MRKATPVRSFFRWLFFLSAVGVVATLAWTVHQSSRLTPRAAYDAGRRAAFGPDRNADLAFRHLDFALRGAEAVEDRALAVEVLKARGRLFDDLGSLPRARQDYEEVLRRYVPDDLESQLALADVLLALGEDAEAYERIEAVLEVTPDHGRALAIRAELDLRYANNAMQEAELQVELTLPPADREQAMASLSRAACLPRDDARRLRLLDGLRTHFPSNEERVLQDVIESLDLATEHNERARKALVASFQAAATPTTLIAYYDLLIRSGRIPLALEFALAALAHEGLTPRPDFLLRTLQLLQTTGQPHLALEVVEEHLGGNMPGPNFYERWCRMLYDAERWEDLIIVATAFAECGLTDQRRQAFGYVGLAQVALGNFEQGQMALRPFLANEPPEPFPGAIALGWRQLARCYREEGRTEEEAGALRMAAAKGRGRMQDEAELWLRLYEIGSTESGAKRAPRDLEGILTWAMCVAPERVDEIMPRWHELGRRNLEVERIDLREVFDEMVATQTYSPPSTAGSYELFELASLFAARGIHPGVIQCCNALLTYFPGFQPAEELMIESRLALGDKAGVLRVLQARMARMGPSSELVARMEALGPAVIGADQRLVLMRADPSGYARRNMLVYLEEHGELAQMVDGLLALPEDQLSDADRLRAAQLLVELGHGAEVGVVLDRLGPDTELQARAAGLRLRAALAVLDWDAFDLQLAGVMAAEDLDEPTLRDVLEELVALGEGRRALELATWLDGRPSTRSALVVLRGSQAARQLGERLAAEEGLVRADAAMTDGSPELGYLIDAVEGADWGRVPERVAALRATRFVPNDLSSVILDALAEDFGGAAARLAEGAARMPGEPAWALARAAVAELMALELDAKVLPGVSEAIDHQTVLAVRGPQGHEHDPRQVLAVLLALEHPNWRGWALSVCEARDEPDSAALWYGFLAAREWMRRGRPGRAREHAEELTAGWPEFAAAWDLLESADLAELERLQGAPLDPPFDQPSLVRWRQREVLGAMPGDPAIEHWMAGLEAERNGDLEVARSAVSRAVDLAPADVRFRLTMARLYARSEDWAPALLAMDVAISRADADTRLLVAERALELHRWILDDPPGAAVLADVARQRENLEQRFATDPLVTVDRARTDLMSWTTQAERGLSRALKRMERLRKRTDKRPLESLRPGATRMWFEFLLELDPSAALRFVGEELRLRPEWPDLWRMLAEANERNVSRTSALDLRRFLQASLPSAVDARALVRLLAMGGGDAQAFEEAVTATLVQEDLPEPDDDLRLQAARFLLESGKPSWPEARQRLAELWADHGERFLAAAARPPDPEDADAPPPLFGGQESVTPPSAGPWRLETTAEDAERTLEIGRLYARLLAWMGRREDASTLDEVSRTVDRLQDDRLADEVLSVLRALIPRPEGVAASDG